MALTHYLPNIVVVGNKSTIARRNSVHSPCFAGRRHKAKCLICAIVNECKHCFKVDDDNVVMHLYADLFYFRNHFKVWYWRIVNNTWVLHMPAPLSYFPCGEEQEAVITIKAFPSATSTRALTTHEQHTTEKHKSTSIDPSFSIFLIRWDKSKAGCPLVPKWWIVYASFTTCVGS